MKDIAYHKSFQLSLDIIKLYKYLTYEKREFIMSKQILRSGTSIGANLSEGKYGQSRRDFLSKINIALKEAVETKYWLQLLYESKYVDAKAFQPLLYQCKEIIRILSSSVKTTKKQLFLENSEDHFHS